MEENVFVVASPLQYITAVELATTQNYNGHNNILLIISDSLSRIDYMRNYIEKANLWSECYELDTNSYGYPSSDYRAWKKYFSEALKLIEGRNIKYFVIGNLGSIIQYALLQKVKKKVKKVIALDDGIPSINILNSRNHNTFYDKYHWRDLRVTLKSILALNIFLPFYRTIKTIEFFTIFNLSGGINDIITTNNLTVIRNLYTKQEDDSSLVYFVGQNIVDKGIIAEEEYLRTLKFIKEIYNNKQVKYITHRSEGTAIIQKVKNIFEVISFKSPLELALLENKMPSEIAGFYSSALFTLRRIHPKIRVTSYRFNDMLISDQELEPKTDILRIYDVLELDKQIEIIKL